MFSITVDKEKCTGCGVCKYGCPKGFKVWRIEERANGRKAVAADQAFCLLCSMCVTRCPTSAIKIEIT